MAADGDWKQGEQKRAFRLPNNKNQDLIYESEPPLKQEYVSLYPPFPCVWHRMLKGMRGHRVWEFWWRKSKKMGGI